MCKAWCGLLVRIWRLLIDADKMRLMVLYLTWFLACRTQLILIDSEMEFLILAEFWPIRLWEDSQRDWNHHIHTEGTYILFLFCLCTSLWGKVHAIWNSWVPGTFWYILGGSCACLYLQAATFPDCNLDPWTFFFCIIWKYKDTIFYIDFFYLLINHIAVYGSANYGHGPTSYLYKKNFFIRRWSHIVCFCATMIVSSTENKWPVSLQVLLSG